MTDNPEEPLLPKSCYICLEECDNTSPCKCQAVVHHKCLWEFNSKNQKSKCTICQRGFDPKWTGHCVLCLGVMVVLFVFAAALAGGFWEGRLSIPGSLP